MKTIVFITTILFISFSSIAQQDRGEVQRLKMNNSILKENIGTISNINYVKSKKLVGKHSSNVTMRNGKVMTVRNGKLELLKYNVTMRNGTIVMPNGLIYLPDHGGTVLRMQEGCYIDMYGKIQYNTRTLNKIVKNY
jgi:hypothetical protein